MTDVDNATKAPDIQALSLVETTRAVVSVTRGALGVLRRELLTPRGDQRCAARCDVSDIVQCRPIVAATPATLASMRRGLLRLALVTASGAIDRARVIAMELNATAAVAALDAAATAMTTAHDAAHALVRGSLDAPFATEGAGFDANGSEAT